MTPRREQVGIMLPSEAKARLVADARGRGVAASALAAEIVCRGLGMEPPEPPARVYARDALPLILGMACRAGRAGITVGDVRRELGVGRSAAGARLRQAMAGGLLTRGRLVVEGKRGRPLLYFPTDLGHRVAEAGD